MVSKSKNSKPQLDQYHQNHFPFMVDYPWFEGFFRAVLERLDTMEKRLDEKNPSINGSVGSLAQLTERKFYTVAEFAVEVDRATYTVRDWCRMERIHAEKTDDDEWRIPREELTRLRDHGLLPARYLR